MFVCLILVSLKKTKEKVFPWKEHHIERGDQHQRRLRCFLHPGQQKTHLTASNTKTYEKEGLFFYFSSAFFGYKLKSTC